VSSRNLGNSFVRAELSVLRRLAFRCDSNLVDHFKAPRLLTSQGVIRSESLSRTHLVSMIDTSWAVEVI
jgi:hypothetical protein